MSTYAKEITALINSQPENKIIEASVIYEKANLSAPVSAYYKALERKVKSGELVHLTKGLYYRPRTTKFGKVPISENEILMHYVSGGRGVVIGYSMFNRKGLTTQIGKQVEVLSNNLTENRKHVKNVFIQRTDIRLTPERVSAIETLEIIQNFNRIEDLNIRAFTEYMNKYARKYSEQVVEYVLAHRKYKKSTIAFLEKILSSKGIPNSLNKYLSPMSEYMIPDLEEIYETA